METGPGSSPGALLIVLSEDRGELAQLGERLVCNQEVTGSIPVFSTTSCFRMLPSGAVPEERIRKRVFVLFDNRSGKVAKALGET